ncbi:MAG: phosphate acyltransferase PlsX [Clostridiales bacterium]|jgi:glycerol-3-phosphate acyltransferase PlsX|nr:phosphate acyltransferase PlsX [Clostridiales bacterium]
MEARRINIIVDAMGGDNAPDMIVAGACAAAEKFNVEITLVGKADMIEPLVTSDKCKVVHASEVIENSDVAIDSIKAKRDSSMVKGLIMLREGEGNAFVSAGNTGALISAATLFVHRLKGVKRVALAALIPTQKGKMMLMDAGANLVCKPEYITQFGVMGAIYIKKVFDVENPKVGLLNVGAEASKGTDTYRQAHEMLAESGVDFIGNVEAREFYSGVCDCLVADGFAGNIMLKSIEGTAQFMNWHLKRAMLKNAFAKLMAMGLKGSLKGMKKQMDYKSHGGAPMLGVAGNVIKAHGSSDSVAIFNAIGEAIKFAESGVNDEIVSHLAK